MPMDFWLLHYYQCLQKKLKLNGGGKLRVLDIGCGNGSLSNLIAQQGYEVVGMEESPSGAEIASQNFPNCQFIQASIYDSPKAELLLLTLLLQLRLLSIFFIPKN
ncbi:class I SAM-dependent methyltransferase [Moorena producens]|uniref:class I SAM-dependent methyltransferase n=1 Tax=Moorena producens TaxID=1155739 RepID=UPI00227736AF|nr:class I SAM-dependent methyltransferase [Moorena producens]